MSASVHAEETEPQLPPSPIDRLLALPRAERIEIVRGMSPDEAASMYWDWRVWARPKQLAPPGNWQTWLNMGGRGSGKTRTGAEWVQEQARTSTTGRGALIATTFSDVRETMIEGESGILNIASPHFRPVLQLQRQRLVWPNGASAKMFSAEKPRRLRGPQHEWVWGDEIAAWQYPREAYDQIMFGLRIGPAPKLCLTTTPKPIELLIALSKDMVSDWELRTAAAGSAILRKSIATVVTTATSYENRENLAEQWYNRTIKPYEGTRLGDQEILAKLLTDIPGALWKMATIEASRLKSTDRLPAFKRIVVACDPAVTSGKGSNETGIVVAAVGENGHGYVLTDRSGRLTPDRWARELIGLYEHYAADRVVAEVNNGGDLVKMTIHTIDPNVAFRSVVATRGKVIRAEPIAALYEQGKIHHVGTFGALESQMTTWVPDSGLDSPDRMDALVWALTSLMLKVQGVFVV